LTQSETNSSQYGLKDDWQSIQRTLEEIIPVYDKTNRYISLGTDLKLRKRGIELLLSEFSDGYFTLLDFGCGTGTMTHLLREKSNTTGVVLVDPIAAMMRVAIRKTSEEGLLAVYESLPFRKESIDAAMAGFSLRDARDLNIALEQISGLLKQNGKFLIVDLSKPDSSTKRFLISIYWRGIAPAIAFLSSGRLGLKFGALSKTYKRLPKISEFLIVARKHGFEISKSEFSMMGGASIILLSKQ
jgi:demethylmenaquinone methyltransferase / 2-methoxy-6-polyprenyl-1,4-benzoquinol methylase